MVDKIRYLEQKNSKLIKENKNLKEKLEKWESGEFAKTKIEYVEKNVPAPTGAVQAYIKPETNDFEQQYPIVEKSNYEEDI